MSNPSSSKDQRGLAGRLNTGEVVRLRSAVDPDLCRAETARPADWTAVDEPCARCAVAPFEDDALEAALAAALAPEGLAPVGPLLRVRHTGGDHGLPKGEGLRLLLDLADGRSFHGGLVLTGDTPMTGWRPEAGAVTLFDGANPPLLSMVTENAPSPRMAVLAGVTVL